MEGWQIALVVKPIGLLILCAPGAALAYFLKRRMPHGALRRILLYSWRI